MPDVSQCMKGEIKQGKENAVSNAQLQETMHISRREVSAAIHALRAEGMIICADQGYYMPKDDAELIAGYDILWKRAVSGLSTLKSMRAEIVKRGLLPMTAEGKAQEARRNKV